MRRTLTVLLAALPLSLAVPATAGARGPGDGGGWGGWGWGGGGQQSQVTVDGTIVSVDASANSFVANAYETEGGGGYDGGGSGGWDGGRGERDARHHGGGSDSTTPTTTQVTITTGSNTDIRVNGRDATISGLAAGQTFDAEFAGTPGTDITTLVTNNPAESVTAYTPPQAYAFVGTVTAVDTTANTVTVTVSNSLPSGLVASGASAVFSVGGQTTILGGSSTTLFGQLSNVSVGDVVAGGLTASAGETLSQVEATPLKLLIDFPASSGTGHSTRTSALNKAASLLGIKTKAKTKANGRGKAKAKKSKSHKHRS